MGGYLQLVYVRPLRGRFFILLLIRRFRSLRSLHQRLWMFAAIGDACLRWMSIKCVSCCVNVCSAPRAKHMQIFVVCEGGRNGKHSRRGGTCRTPRLITPAIVLNEKRGLHFCNPRLTYMLDTSLF